MSSKLATILTVAAVCLFGARSADAQRAGGNARPQFSVVTSGENSILIDQREGRTWLLAHSPGGGTPAWVPIQRIDNPEEAQHWREEQHALAEQREREHREHHQREMQERLEQRRREMAERRAEFERQGRTEGERAEEQRHGHDHQPTKEAEQRELPGAESEESEVSGARERLKQLGEQTQRAMLESLQKHRKRMIEQFGKEHPAVKSIGEQIERLSRELKKVTSESTEPKKAPSDAKRDGGSPKPPPEKSPPQPPEKQPEEERSSVLESIRKQLDAAKREGDLQRIRKQLDAVKEQVDVESIRKQLEAVKRQVDELLSERRDGASSERLRDLQVKEELLLETHGTDHPEVRAVRIEIEAIRSVNGDSSPSDSARSDKEAETSQNAERQDEANDGSGARAHQEEEASTHTAPSHAQHIRRPPVEGALTRFRLQLDDLRDEEESLLKFYGADHPKVRDNQSKTELLEMLLQESHLGERATELLPLLLEERKLLEQHGPKHPEVQAIRKRIERMREMLEELRSQENWAYFMLIADESPQVDAKAGAIGETDADTKPDAAEPAEDR